MGCSTLRGQRRPQIGACRTRDSHLAGRLGRLRSWLSGPGRRCGVASTQKAKMRSSIPSAAASRFHPCRRGCRGSRMIQRIVSGGPQNRRGPRAPGRRLGRHPCGRLGVRDGVTRKTGRSRLPILLKKHHHLSTQTNAQMFSVRRHPPSHGGRLRKERASRRAWRGNNLILLSIPSSGAAVHVMNWIDYSSQYLRSQLAGE